MKEQTMLYRLNNQLKKLKENVHFSVQELQKRNAQYGGHFSDGKKAINDDYLLIFCRYENFLLYHLYTMHI